MLHTTLRQMASISGRTILAIGLTMGAMTVWTSAAKAEDIIVQNEAISTLTFTPVAANSLKGAALDTAGSSGLTAGTIAVQSNSGTTWKVKATSTNGSFLKIAPGDADALGVAYTVDTVSKSGAPRAATGTVVTGTTLTAATPVVVYTTNGTTSEVQEVQLDIIIKTATDGFKTHKAGSYADTVVMTYTGT